MILPGAPRAISRRPTARERRKRGGQVHGEHDVPVLVGVFDRRRPPDRAGIVDEDVDRAERCLSVGRDPRGNRRVAEVAGHHCRASAQRLNPGGGVLGDDRLDVAHDIRARLRQRKSDRLPQASGRAGHERRAAVESKEIEEVGHGSLPGGPLEGRE